MNDYDPTKHILRFGYRAQKTHDSLVAMRDHLLSTPDANAIWVTSGDHPERELKTVQDLAQSLIRLGLPCVSIHTTGLGCRIETEVDGNIRTLRMIHVSSDDHLRGYRPSAILYKEWMHLE